ncbi:MAG TPA: WhiB family transcriptional regulator [Iamia sp.]|nr:WhiB family transcriptional regulator [Iamia sp.]
MTATERSPGPDRDRDWTAQAACRGRLDLFYAPHAERPSARARREAEGRRVCNACPVRDACRSHARQHLELGLWGGETEEERAAAGCPPSPASRRLRVTG